MVLQKLREKALERRDPFATKGFEKLSLEEQEEALTRVATEEARLIEKEKQARIGKAVSPGIRKLRKKSISQRGREFLEKKQQERRRGESKAVASPVRLSTPLPSQRLSEFQKKILEREKVLALLRRTPPMARAREMRKASSFQRQLDSIRGFDAIEKARGNVGRTQSGLVKGSPAQEAQRRFKEKVNSANQGLALNQEGIQRGGVLPSRLKAPPTLL